MTVDRLGSRHCRVSRPPDEVRRSRYRQSGDHRGQEESVRSEVRTGTIGVEMVSKVDPIGLEKNRFPHFYLDVVVTQAEPHTS